MPNRTFVALSLWGALTGSGAGCVSSTGPAGPVDGAAPAGKGGVGTGGVMASGGTTSAGGAPAAGGATSSGGRAASGGAMATGGLAASGDAGGKPGLGGVTGSGDTTGGAAATGGQTASGGAPGTGGAIGMGGASATCQPASCGTHKWACWPMPNPASSGLPNAASYRDLGNGTVLDNVTCLVWEKAPGTTQADWQTNADHCASLAGSSYGGYDDWRLPTRIEMASLVDYTKTGDAINTAAFGKEPSGYYRTASDWYETITGQNGSGFAWIYGMSSGFTSNAYPKTSNAYVRCVRGNGAGEAQNALAVPPPNQYTVAAGEVTDHFTGLVWQQTDSATPPGGAVVPRSGAAAVCAALTLNGHAWRLPSINELATLVDEARVGPAINRTTFPNTKAGSKSNNWYWANATYGTSSYGWAINFDDGFTGYNSGASGDWNNFTGAWVRCVH